MIETLRIRPANSAPVRDDGSWVLYWMIAARRPRFNLALDHAADWARSLGKPLVVLEALRCDYPWASDRLHRFILDGMADNAAAFRSTAATHHPYVEPERGAGRGLLSALAEQSAVVVTDDYPTFFLPRMVAAAARKLPVLLETVDGNGLLPMRAADRAFPTAYGFRRFVQQRLATHLEEVPLENPLADLPPAPRLPDEILERWPAAEPALLAGDDEALAALPIDHSVSAAPAKGGWQAAEATLRRFLDDRLERYADRRNRPDDDAASGLSPYLHFGHISAHQVFLELVTRQRWSPEDTIAPANGRRAGWWGLPESAEGFLDQLVTWRELGFNNCHHLDHHDRYESLPEWAQRTLAEHAADPRDYSYSLAEFAAANTHDPLWNAAQNQLLREGRLHNYLRMLWGKKILEWSESPQQALAVMIELNNRYALDGRDPNSYTGIFWVLGRHDRAWGPERPVFGKVRYMSSENTARKVPVKRYLETYS